MLVKKALIRCSGECCPIGTIGHMHLDCSCGIRLEFKPVPHAFTCPCGTEYDEQGWIVKALQHANRHSQDASS